MKGIVADADVLGQVERIVAVVQGKVWGELWRESGLRYFSFEQLNLDSDSSDAEVWDKCQAAEDVLITGNRNADDPDSLEATIESRNQPSALPVFTLADAQRILNDSEYVELIAESLLDYLMSIDNIRGTGRLFLP